MRPKLAPRRLLLGAGATVSALALLLIALSAYRLLLVDQLYDAVERGSVADVRVLLKRGADPNQADPLGGPTPLMEAVQDDRCEVATALIEGGARLDLRDGSGQTIKNYIHSDNPRMAAIIAAATRRSGK